MRIAIGCDHIVTDVKMSVSDHLKAEGYEVSDYGTYDFTRTHYPIYGRKVAEAVVKGDADLGIIMCGTGVGISNGANKVNGARTALVRDISTAVYAREHLNANVLAFGGKITGQHVIFAAVDAFLKAKYQPTDESEKLIEKIKDLESTKNHADDDHIFDEYIEKWKEGVDHD